MSFYPAASAARGLCWAFRGHRKERPGTISRSSQVWIKTHKGQVVFQGNGGERQKREHREVKNKIMDLSYFHSLEVGWLWWIFRQENVSKIMRVLTGRWVCKSCDRLIRSRCCRLYWHHLKETEGLRLVCWETERTSAVCCVFTIGGRQC